MKECITHHAACECSRKAFEEFFFSYPYGKQIALDNGVYIDDEVQLAWEAWVASCERMTK